MECKFEKEVSRIRRIEEINKTLTDLHEQLLKMNMRACVLQVDIATQMNPHMVEALNTTTTACNSCSNRVTDIYQAAEEQTSTSVTG